MTLLRSLLFNAAFFAWTIYLLIAGLPLLARDRAELGGVVSEIDRLFSQRFDELVRSLELGKPPRGGGAGGGSHGGGRRPRHLH